MISFNRAPPIGTVIRLDKQEYELVRTTAHRRKDGTATTLLLWSAHCPACGVEFGVTSGLVSKSLNRRCAEHRQPFKPVSGKRKKVKVAVDEA